MSKQKIIKVALTVLLSLVIISAVVLAIIDIIDGGMELRDVLRCIAIIGLAAMGIERIYTGPGPKRSLAFYEREYADKIKDAFSDSKENRRKLLVAIRYYNEDKLKEAMETLSRLKRVCKKESDFYAVWLFSALTLTDAGLREEAVLEYNSLLDMNISSTTVYGNLGSLYSSLGKYDDAIRSLRLSLQNDDRNPAAYQNLAKLYFDNYDFEMAERCALQALSINHKMRQPATLLAVVYSMRGDTENAQKYSHIAISSGEDPATLKSVIARYSQAKNISKEEKSE